ncbi:MAG: hypothetical protein HY754_10445 [Nitrospirae bacterium]|nr:hypothetical protein [Nitrospirota bacterium]
MAKVRFQMFLDESQKSALERLQHDSKMPVAEIIRKAIDKFLAEWKQKKQMPVRDVITEKLLSVAGICNGGPKDLADNHDHYLYGMPKKK